MYRACGLWLSPNFGVQLTAEKNFYFYGREYACVSGFHGKILVVIRL